MGHKRSANETRMARGGPLPRGVRSSGISFEPIGAKEYICRIKKLKFDYQNKQQSSSLDSSVQIGAFIRGPKKPATRFTY
jgi:hypothetical protein